MYVVGVQCVKDGRTIHLFLPLIVHTWYITAPLPPPLSPSSIMFCTCFLFLNLAQRSSTCHLRVCAVVIRLDYLTPVFASPPHLNTHTHTHTHTLGLSGIPAHPSIIHLLSLSHLFHLPFTPYLTLYHPHLHSPPTVSNCPPPSFLPFPCHDCQAPHHYCGSSYA